MVLMHMMHKKCPHDILVAHFDHGIRANSRDDYDFVEREAKQLGLDFVGEHARLGANCSEDEARAARYAFLYKCAETYSGKIYTAHHADDIIESIIINLLRGTGWRGLSPMRNQRLERPLSRLTKTDIYKYAATNQLCFRQDQTNYDDKYLRNRIRDWLLSLDKTERQNIKDKLLQYYLIQCDLAQGIDEILARIETKTTYSRKFFESIDDVVAIELLRQILKKHHISLTRPQLGRTLVAIRTFKTNSKFSLNKDYFMTLSRQRFTFQPTKN